MTGYKATDMNGCCRGFKFEVGKTYTKDTPKEELEHKISILLSCKNCPENKGGYICENEYEGKCLSQKTQSIKELQDEIVELKAQIEKLKKQFDPQDVVELMNEIEAPYKLTEAKEIIKNIEKVFYNGENAIKRLSKISDILEEAEQFLKE